ncbi:hypothetical protein Agub_g14917 [Astrephomene gubernaculifera]|uniref:Uncharacterized protein n=1 Tax=Astrephomene gubernaculifera TaxID=47775 RepID=A0AAD3E4A0_9CHLO|nr:hypothetical protein Agub_g14917 [Astrephomene gubernaculifera]
MVKNLHVVILAGGYSPEIARGAVSGPHHPPGSALAAAASSAGGVAVPALLPLDGVPALVRLLRAIQSARRVQLEAVWVVHNQSDAAAIKGAGGLFSASPASDVGLPALNFLSNAALGPSSWAGEVADLRTALAAIRGAAAGGKGAGAGAAAGGPCVVALSAQIAFMPNYNMQRLFEHAYLRGRDVLGSSLLNGVDLAVLGEEGYTRVVPGDDSALPRIAELQPRASGSEAMMVAESFMCLRPETVIAVAAGAGGAAASLPDLAGALIGAGGYVAALDLMFGRYNLRSARAVEYVDKFFSFCATAARNPSLVGLKPDAVLQPYHNNGNGSANHQLPEVPAAGSFIGRSTAANFRFDELQEGGLASSPSARTGRIGPATATSPTSPASLEAALRGSDYEAFVRCSSAFNDLFFGSSSEGGAAGEGGRQPEVLPPAAIMGAAGVMNLSGRGFGTVAGGGTWSSGGGGLKQYLLPPTFYMTAYRRQGADMMW